MIMVVIVERIGSAPKRKWREKIRPGRRRRRKTAGLGMRRESPLPADSILVTISAADCHVPGHRDTLAHEKQRGKKSEYNLDAYAHQHVQYQRALAVHKGLCWPKELRNRGASAPERSGRPPLRACYPSACSLSSEGLDPSPTRPPEPIDGFSGEKLLFKGQQREAPLPVEAEERRGGDRHSLGRDRSAFPLFPPECCGRIP